MFAFVFEAPLLPFKYNKPWFVFWFQPFLFPWMLTKHQASSI